VKKPARAPKAPKSPSAPPAEAPAPEKGPVTSPESKTETAPAAPAKVEKPKAAPAKKAARPAAKPSGTSAKPALPLSAPLTEKFPPTATVVDASGLILGRAASLIAQRLLKGETIVVVNAERSVVTGERHMVLNHFIAARARGSVRSGPHYPRYPDRIFRRAVRGMLPHLKTRGKVAFERLHVFIGVPPGLSERTMTPLPDAKARPALRPPTSLADITRLLGARL
jgi:large subunit ribosomal protein L13